MTKPARQLQPCGTWAAYKRHHYHAEPACDACREAARERERVQRRTRYRKESPEVRERRLARVRAAARAKRVTPRDRMDSCAWCGATFTTSSANKKFCERRCQRAEKRWRDSLYLPNAAPAYGVVRSLTTGVERRTLMQLVPSGGHIVWCPTCGLIASTLGTRLEDPMVRRCCDTDFRILEVPTWPTTDSPESQRLATVSPVFASSDR